MQLSVWKQLFPGWEENTQPDLAQELTECFERICCWAPIHGYILGYLAGFFFPLFWHAIFVVPIGSQTWNLPHPHTNPSPLEPHQQASRLFIQRFQETFTWFFFYNYYKNCYTYYFEVFKIIITNVTNISW